MATYRTRTAKDGTASVQVQVRLAGHPSQGATFPSKREAQKWAATIEAAMLEGRHFKGSVGRKRTLADAIAKYRAEVLPQLKNGSMYGFTLDWWEANHGQQKIGEVSRSWLSDRRADILAGTFRRATPGSKRSIYHPGKPPETGSPFHTGRRVSMLTHGLAVKPKLPAGTAIKGSLYDHAQNYAQPQQYTRTPATANRYMAALSSVFGYVCGDWEWLNNGQNPFAGFGRLDEGKRKGKAYADHARARLLQETAKDPQLHTLTLVALSTAARAGELLSLTWSHVELGETEGRLMFEDTKNGDARVAWLYGEALEAMKAHKAKRWTGEPGLPAMLDVPVFPGRWSHKHQRYGRYDYLPRLNKALAAAGIQGMRKPFHALRHTAATNMARMGANAHQLKALGGWKSDAVNVYVHMAAQDTRELAMAHQKKLTNQGESK